VYRAGMSDGTRSPVFLAKSDDPEMARAVTRAVDTFKYLWRELTWEYRRIVPALELSAIKAAFNDPEGGVDDVEHMWLSDVEFDGDVISATLMNAPNELTSVQQGDQITLRRDEIEDWMYVREGRVYGGFTIQVLRAGMSSADRHGHDTAWGFTFAEPGRVDLVPNWQEKGKKGLLGRLFGGGAPPPGDPDAEHPMSENMAAGLQEAVEKDRNAFFELGPAGLNILHSLALGGSAACVRALLAAGADPQLKTATGKTARELATMMGWPRVVELLREAESVARS
jgi:uncharacterized protein YegJ (DUF2314 family)